MAITASQITSANTLDEFRREFNNLVSDVVDVKNNNIFGVGINFEGSSADAYETALNVVNPTADRTVLIPNEDGTLLTTGTSVLASTISVADNESTNENNAILFAADASYTGTVSIESDGDLHYNPSTGTVAATIFSGALSGNATTATALATGRTIASTGDVTWTSASFDGSGNVTGTAAIGSGVIVNDDVNTSAAIAMSKTALVDGTGLTLSTNTLSVDAAQTQITSVGTLTGLVIADDGNIGSASDTDAISISATGVVGISQDLVITGNLTVNGATVTNSAANTVIEDTLIELNTGATTNANDMGFVMERGSTGDNAFMGWDESADTFVMGTTTNTGVDTGNLTITTGTLVANVEGNLTGTIQTAAQTNVTSVGALDGGSITSNFGTIDTGSSTITTTGIITGGTLTSTGSIIVSDGGNIGSATDTDAIAIASSGVTTFSQGMELSEYLYLNGDEKELRWYNGVNYVGFAASTSLAGNQIYKLPVSDASSTGDALVSDAAGNLSFSGTVGSNATTVTLVATNTTDASHFMNFTDAATGNENIRTDTGLIYNPSSGTLTSTVFSGNLTGNVTGTIVTAAQTNITSVGALVGGSIASGFGTISTGNAITTTGTITGGGLVIADDGTIGSTTDTDAISVSSAGVVGFSATTAASATTTAAVTVAGGLGVAGDIWVGDDIVLDSDSASIQFGDAQEITLSHVLNTGLTLKHAASGDDKYPTLAFASGDDDIAADNILGKLTFSAPDEGAGTDAITVAAALSAVSEGDFSASNNATKLQFSTGISEAASTAMELSSTGELSFPNKQGGDNLLIDSTNGSANAGDDITLNGTDVSSTNADSNIIFEEAVALTTQTDRHVMKRMMGEMGEEMKSIFPNRMRLISSTGATLRTLYCAGDSNGS